MELPLAMMESLANGNAASMDESDGEDIRWRMTGDRWQGTEGQTVEDGTDNGGGWRSDRTIS
jgi:hypothetical protein